MKLNSLRLSSLFAASLLLVMGGAIDVRAQSSVDLPMVISGADRRPALSLDGEWHRETVSVPRSGLAATRDVPEYSRHSRAYRRASGAPALENFPNPLGPVFPSRPFQHPPPLVGVDH